MISDRIKHPRPFASTDEMNEALVKAWNAKVGPDDEVYHLGDVSFMHAKPTKEILYSLNGKIHLILGNHDKGIKGDIAKRFEWIKPYYELRLAPKDPKVILCHFAFRVWNKGHHGAWNLYGHSHNSLSNTHRQMDVGVDTREDFAPWSVEEITEVMATRESKVRHH